MGKRFNYWKKDIIAVSLLLLIVCVFFSRLFYPSVSLYITPEFNGSDATNFNIPVKLVLSEAYKAGKVPLWEKTIGTGFPIFAEMQIGYFFLPNIILFGLLPFALAFNLGYVVTFFLGALGMYIYLRSHEFSEIVSAFGAFIFTFSGFFLGHMNHYNMLQAAALMPWLILLFDKLRNKLSIVTLLLFSLVLSQQIFAGYPQITFITLCTIVGLYMVDLTIPLKHARQNLKEMIKLTALAALGTGIAIILAAVLLIPAFELVGLVTRPENYTVTNATFYSFPFKQFLGFLSPFIFGSLKLGTFPEPAEYEGVFFWETAQYIGFLPIILIIGFLIKRFRSRKTLILMVFVAIFCLLMLGKFSPIYFIYSLPPFNMFRVPARFILSVLFGLSILFAFALKEISVEVTKKFTPRKKDIIIAALFLITIADIFYYWFNYHPVVHAKKWLQDPPFVQYI